MKHIGSSSPLIARLVAVGLATCWVSPAAFAATSDAWVEAHSSHFRVVGPAQASPAKVAARLEVFRDVLERRGHTLNLEQGRTLTVVLLPGEALLAAQAGNLIRGETKYAGISVPNRAQPYVLVNTKDPDEDVLTTAYRGVLDVMLALEQESQPLWFREGVAAYYQTFGTIRSSALVGRPVREYLPYLRENRLLPLRQVLAMKRAELDRLGPKERLLFTAEAWAMVHQGFAAGYEGMRQLSRLMDLMEQGAPAETAVRQAYGQDSATLERRLVDYARSRRMTYAEVRFDRLAYSDTIRMTTVPRDTVLVELETLRHGDTEFAGLVRAPTRPQAAEYPLSARLR